MLRGIVETDVVALCEAVLLLGLWARNRCFDRANVLFHVPILAQQMLQALLWPHVSTSPDETTCSVENIQLSFILTLVIGATPQWFAWVLLIQRHAFEPPQQGVVPGPAGTTWARQNLGFNRGDNDWPRRRATAKVNGLFWLLMNGARLFMFYACFYFSMRFYFAPQGNGSWFAWFFGGSVCTTIGPTGHQIWPMLVYSHWVPKAFTVVSFAMVGGRFDLLTRPSYVPIMLGPAAGASGLLVWLGGDEWCSECVCWVGLSLCILYLAEPILFRFYRVLDSEVLSDEGAEHRTSWGFTLAWKHIHEGMRPWVDYADADGDDFDKSIFDLEMVEPGSATPDDCV